MRVSKRDHDDAVARLRELLPPGSTVFCVLRHVSRSGMQRIISFYALVPDGKGGTYPQYLDGYISSAVGLPRASGMRDGLKVNGCGMDMGFHVVYELGYALYGRGGWGCIGERCPSNDHSNGDRNYAKHTKRRPHLHTDGGYALRSQWL